MAAARWRLAIVSAKAKCLYPAIVSRGTLRKLRVPFVLRTFISFRRVQDLRQAFPRRRERELGTSECDNTRTRIRRAKLALTAAPKVSLTSGRPCFAPGFRLALPPSSHSPTLHTPGQKSEHLVPSIPGFTFIGLTVFGHFNNAALHRSVTHDFTIGFLVGRLKTTRRLGFIFSGKKTLQKNRLFHPVNGWNENLASDFQAGRSVVIRGNTVIIGKFKFGFDSNFHPFHISQFKTSGCLIATGNSTAWTPTIISPAV